MSWRDDLTTARARLAALETAELQVLVGERVTEVGSGSETIKYSNGATLDEIRKALAETRMVIQGLAGERKTGGVINPMFGSWG